MTQTLKVSDARKQLFQLTDKTERLRNRYILTKDGKPQSVLMSAEEFEEWMETVEILSDKKLMRDIRAGQEDIRKGRTRSFEEVFGKPLRASR